MSYFMQFLFLSRHFDKIENAWWAMCSFLLVLKHLSVNDNHTVT